jgi:glycine oxidase
MKHRVIIVGAGVVGCLTAMSLHKKGAQVTLIERGELGAESSWAGGGILFPLLPWDYAASVNELALTGAAMYPALVSELISTTGIDPEYTISGLRALPPIDRVIAEQWCAENDVELEVDDGALWLPSVAQIRNPRLIQALKRWLELNRVPIVTTEVIPLSPQQDRVTKLHTRQGRGLDCDELVITAGAWSQAVLGSHALSVALKPMRGQMLLYRQAAGLLREILYCNDFYLIPRRDGHILAGSTVEDVGFDKTTTAQAAEDLRRKAARLLPALAHQKPIQHWSGLRPGSPDNIPVIARHPALENVWLNTGHFRYGVTMAPASAEILMCLMCGDVA